MPNAYTEFRNKQKTRKSKRAVSSQRRRVGAGGARRVRTIANQPIEAGTSTGVAPLDTDQAEQAQVVELPELDDGKPKKTGKKNKGKTSS